MTGLVLFRLVITITEKKKVCIYLRMQTPINN